MAVYAHVGGQQRLVPGVFLDCFPFCFFFFLKQGLSLNVELIDLARLIGQGAPEILRSLS